MPSTNRVFVDNLEELAVTVTDGENQADVIDRGTYSGLGVVILDADGNPTTLGSGGVSQADNSAFTVGTDSGTPVMGIYQATPTALTDGRVGVAALTVNRVMKAALHDAAGAAITTLPVSLASVPSHAVTNAGTFAVQAAGDVAHNAVDSGAPVKVGGYASSTTPTSVSSGNRVNLWLNPGGATVLSGGATEMSGDGQSLGVPLVQRVGNASAGPLGVLPIYFNGTNMDRARGDTANGLDVDVTRLPALAAGTNAIGKLAANSGVDIGDVDVTSIAAGTNLIGDVGIQPRTSNGLTTFMASGSDGSSILVATAQVIKASAGQLYGYYAFNPEAATTFVHFYNTAAASVTVGTTNPLFTLAIPAGAAANLMTDIGIPFSNAGWSCAATTTASGAGAPATGVSLVAWYA